MLSRWCGGVGDLRGSYETSAAWGNSQCGKVVFVAPCGRVPAAQGFASPDEPRVLLVLQMNPVELVPLEQYGDLAAFILEQSFETMKKEEMLTTASDGLIQKEDWVVLESLHQNPKLRMLFDRSRKMSHEDVEFMLQLAERIQKERDEE